MSIDVILALLGDEICEIWWDLSGKWLRKMIEGWSWAVLMSDLYLFECHWSDMIIQSSHVNGWSDGFLDYLHFPLYKVYLDPEVEISGPWWLWWRIWRLISGSRWILIFLLDPVIIRTGPLLCDVRWWQLNTRVLVMLPYSLGPWCVWCALMKDDEWMFVVDWVAMFHDDFK
jgi:hypothetical protein